MPRWIESLVTSASCASRLWNDKMARICNKSKRAGTVLMGNGVSSHMSTLTLFFLLTTRALSLSLFFMPFVLALSPSVSLFYSSSICELFNSSTQEWEGEGRVVLAVQREGKEIVIERWFKLQDSKVPKSHTSKGIRAENHSGQSPIIQQQRTVTRLPDRCDFKVECMPPPQKENWEYWEEFRG